MVGAAAGAAVRPAAPAAAAKTRMRMGISSRGHLQRTTREDGGFPETT
jgi:hypothetical protein